MFRASAVLLCMFTYDGDRLPVAVPLHTRPYVQKSIDNFTRSLETATNRESYCMHLIPTVFRQAAMGKIRKKPIRIDEKKHRETKKQREYQIRLDIFLQRAARIAFETFAFLWMNCGMLDSLGSSHVIARAVRAHRSDADNKNAPVHLPSAWVYSEQRARQRRTALNTHNYLLHM